jgi:hypothetical protein
VHEQLQASAEDCKEPGIMDKSKQSAVDPSDRWLDINEVRLVADLRHMHAKVDELYSVIENLRNRHSGSDIVKYADYQMLADNIRRVDEIYLWFLRIRDEREAKRRA